MTVNREGSPIFWDIETGHEWRGDTGSLWKAGPEETETWLVGPALFDPQVNGFGGVDYQAADLTFEAFEHSAREIQRAGCSHFLPTLITASEAFLVERLARFSEWVGRSELLSGTIPGIHLEGPFLSTQPGYPGAHPAAHLLNPDLSLMDRLIEASEGRLKMVTLAPELPGALKLIRHLTGRGIRVCLGHTDADLEICLEAIRAGAFMATHLGNGCPETLHRHENILQRILSLPDLWVSVIPDGFHVPHPALGNLLAGIGAARLTFTTDAVSPAGAGPGEYTVGGLHVSVGSDGRVRHPNGKSFAGSGLRMIDGLHNAVRLGGLGYLPAWRAWTRLRPRLFPGLATPSLAVPFPGNSRAPVSIPQSGLKQPSGETT